MAPDDTRRGGFTALYGDRGFVGTGILLAVVGPAGRAADIEQDAGERRHGPASRTDDECLPLLARTLQSGQQARAHER